MPQYANSTFTGRNARGVQKQLSVDPTGALVAASGNTPATFTGTNVAAATGVVTTVALATTYTGLVLFNPAGSGKNLILRRVSASLSVLPSAITTLGLIAGYASGGITAHANDKTPHCALIGNADIASVAGLSGGATLVGTPYWADILGSTGTATSSASVSRAYDGQIVIPPGGYVAIGTDIASPAAGVMASFLWDEVAA